MVFFRVKSITSSNGIQISYLYLVKNHWDKDKQSSRQKVITYVGKIQGLEPINVKAVFARDGMKCNNCPRQDTLTIDHITPILKGGNNSLDNLQVLCDRCNKIKGNSI